MATTVARLEHLKDMLSKYRNAYYRTCETGGDMSRRMTGWVDEYEELRESPAWEAYCQKNGFSTGHDAYDIFA